MNVRAAVLALVLVAGTLSSEPVAGAVRLGDGSRAKASDRTGFADQQTEVTYGFSLLPELPNVTPPAPKRRLTASTEDCWIKSRTTSCTYSVIAVYSDGEFVYERVCTTTTVWNCY